MVLNAFMIRRLLLSYILSLFLVIFFLLLPSQVQAQAILYQDNFDDGNLDNWYVARNQVHGPLPMTCMFDFWPAAWHIENGKLGFKIDSGSCVSYIIPLDLDLTQADNYQIDFDWLMPESPNMDRNMGFRYQDYQNWYGIKVLNQSINIVKVSDEGNTNSVKNGSTSYPFEADREYHFSVTFTADYRITVSIDGELVLDAYDKWPPLQPWGNKTMALWASAGSIRRSITYFDNLVVRSLDGSIFGALAMPHFYQNDPLWSDNEYDTASSWSQDFPSISRWGCALTSLAMILHYHGINVLPDGTPLTPASLNSWLISQPDGYVGEGLVNWLAATRLTRLVSDQLGTPKLEYGRVFGSSIAPAQSEIAQGKPVILQLPGHFVVSHGVIGEIDLQILDPFYLRQKLSQHQTELLSTRTFTPSFTDLSYILLLHEPGLTVTVTDIDGQPLDDWQTFSEKIDAAPLGTFDLEETKTMMVHQLAKPDSASYLITVSQPETGSFELELLTYDQAANPTTLNQAGTVGPEPLTFQLDYQKDGDSQIAARPASTSFTQLRTTVQQLQAQRQLAKTHYFTVLDRLLAKGEQATTTEQQQRVKTAWQHTLHQSKLKMTPEAYSLLSQMTGDLMVQ
jgi:hypothetical protein